MNVLRKVKIDGKWRMLPVRKTDSGFDWSQVVDGGKPRVATAGTFYLEWREGGKRVRRAVGDHPQEAKRALAAQTKVVSLRSSGIEASDAPIITARHRMEGKSIAEAIAAFKLTAPLKYRTRSQKKYTNALDSFAGWTGKTHLCQLGREDLIDFMGHLVSKEHLDRSTAVDKGHVVYTVMNQHGADIRMKRGDWPKVTEKERGMYETAELDKLFAAADDWEFAVFQTFLLSGMRDQEVGFLAWGDYNSKRATLRVSEKPDLGFAPKNYQERTVPIPPALVRILDDHRKRNGGSYLIFGTSDIRKYRGCPGGQRDRHMLDKLKALAERAGLNCGRCRGTWGGKPTSCAAHPICKHWGLHKFRHTYATNMLRAGVDLVSLQTLLGHSDLDSTRKYLKALAPEDLHVKIAAAPIASHVFERHQNSSPTLL